MKILHYFSLTTLGFVGSCVNLLVAFPSHAIIIGGAAKEFQLGDVQVSVVEPPSVGELQIGAGEFEGTDIFGLNEKQKFTLEQDINIFGFYNFSNPRPTANISLFQGDVVSSHMIWADPPGEGFLGGNGRRYRWEGTIEFERPILGIIPRSYIISPSIPQTNSIFGLDNVNYTGTGSLDNVFDIVTWNDNVLDFKLSAGDGTDHFRVITAAHVPEPLTILGSGLALGFGMFFKKKLRSEEKQKPSKLIILAKSDASLLLTIPLSLPTL